MVPAEAGLIAGGIVTVLNTSRFLSSSSGKESALQNRAPRSIPGSGKICGEEDRLPFQSLEALVTQLGKEFACNAGYLGLQSLDPGRSP